MNDYEKYVIDLFVRYFDKYKNNNILLYGIGDNTKLIIDNFSEYNIIGILDGVRHDEYLYGKYIYRLEDTLKLKPDIIIVVARAASVRIIKKRISGFCVENSILLYDISGNDLLTEAETLNIDDSYFGLDREDLISKIEGYEAISFDLFDTLVMRRVLYPTDVFDIVEKKMSIDNFKKVRSDSERSITLSDPTLDEIYSVVANKLGISEKDAQRIKQCEIEVERDVIIPRHKMVEIFDLCISEGKKVSIITDMYLPQSIIKELLEMNGIKGYDKIYISSEYKSSKSNDLYEIYKSTVNARSYLHIGDNLSADGKAASKYGIDTFIIRSAYDMLSMSNYSALLDFDETFRSRLHIGIFASEVFNDPFALHCSKGKPMLKETPAIGYYLAPVITEFMQWFVNIIKKDNCENVILPARDGYLIKKLYDIISHQHELPRSQYVLTSRIAGMAASAETSDDIRYVCGFSFSGDPKELIKTRFLLDDEVLSEYNESRFGSALGYYNSYESSIIKKSYELKKRYVNYLYSVGFDYKKKTAFFDFTSSGTTQFFLNKILDTELYGYYFVQVLSYDNKKEKLKIRSMLPPRHEYDKQSKLYEKYIFMETILTSPDPTFICISENGKPCFLNESRTESEIQSVMDIQKSIINYFNVYYTLSDICDEYVFCETADKIIGMLEEKYTNICNDFLTKTVLKDECCAREFSVSSSLE